MTRYPVRDSGLGIRDSRTRCRADPRPRIRRIPRIPNPESRSLVRSGGLIHAHPQTQPHGVENLLDLVEALPAEVLRLQHLGLGLGDELADGADVRVLQ